MSATPFLEGSTVIRVPQPLPHGPHAQRAPPFIVRWFKTHVIDATISLFRRGMEPKILAFSLAIGFTTGLFPLCGFAAAVCVALVFVLPSCHLPTALFANFMATPFELSLIIPFMRLGEFIFRAERLAVSPSALLQALTSRSSGKLLRGLAHAVIAWVLISPFVAGLLYQIMLPVAMRFSRRPGPSLLMSPP